MRRSRARLLSGLAALSAASALLALPVVSAQAAHRAAKRPAVRGSVTVDYIVPTRDAKLFLEVVHPTDAAGHIIPAPVILTYTPYAVLGRNGDADHWVLDKGYTRATADVIGTGNSGGCYDYGGDREKRTAHDLVQWIAGRGWSQRKIGMLGGSYEGTTQYAAAVTHPKGLVTIVPEAAIDRWYDYAYSGGVRYTDSNEDLGHEGPVAASDEGIDTPLGFDFGFAIPPPVDASDPHWTDRVASTIRPCDEGQHTNSAYSDQPDYTGFWKDRDYLRQMHTVTIPVLVAHNWGDWNVKQVDGWQVIHALRNSPRSRAIFGGRWHGHGIPQDVKGNFSYSDALDAWMDHWLRGVHDGIPGSLPRITSRSSNDSTELHYTRAPAVHPLALTLSHDSNGFTLRPGHGPAPAGSPAASYTWTGLNTESASAAQPFATGGGYIGFVSPVLKKSLRVFGEPVLHVWSTVQRQWVTTAVSLLDFNPANYQGSGAQTTATAPNAVVAATRGWLDSRYRHGLGQEQFLTPGQPFSENLSFKPTDYTFRAGHRLVLLISTETLEWGKSKLYDIPTADPTVTIDYKQGQSRLILPAAVSGGGAFG
ncbi:MAG: CocE/NonD family hydrolase [Solirubrobacteraceae bacterium]